MKMKKFLLIINQFQMNQYNIFQKKHLNKLIKMNKVLKKLLKILIKKMIKKIQDKKILKWLKLDPKPYQIKIKLINPYKYRKKGSKNRKI